MRGLMRGCKTIAVVIAVLLPLVLGAAPALAQAPAARQKPAAVKPAAAAAEAQPAASPSGGTEEGIKVHGHWVIVIRDAEGKEVDRREFDNALDVGILGGRQALASLLTRNQAISQWLILLTNNGPGGQPCGTATDGHSCGIAERQSSRFPFTSVDYAVGLTVAVDPNNPGQALLVGTTRASNDGLITIVSTMVSLCPPGPPSPTGCADTETFFGFTVASATSGAFNAASVKKGQAMDVTVKFTFS